MTDVTAAFGRPRLPANEAERLQALARYAVQEVPLGSFNHIAQMAVSMFEMPIAIVTIVHADEVVTVAAAGSAPIGARVPRNQSLCSVTVQDDTPTIVENALHEPGLLDNPQVSGPFGLRFYAAAPLTTPDGFHLGAICLIDQEPRAFTAEDQKVLTGLAQIVVDDLLARFGPAPPAPPAAQ